MQCVCLLSDVAVVGLRRALGGLCPRTVSAVMLCAVMLRDTVRQQGRASLLCKPLRHTYKLACPLSTTPPQSLLPSSSHPSTFILLSKPTSSPLFSHLTHTFSPMVIGFLSRSLSRRSSASSSYDSSVASDGRPQSRADDGFNPSPALYWRAPCATAPFYVSRREARRIERNYQKMLRKGNLEYPRS